MGKKVLVFLLVCLLAIGSLAIACQAPEASKQALTPKAAEPAKPIVWNFTIWGSSRAVTKGLEWWGKEMESRTNGQFQLKIHWGDVLSPGAQNLDGIKAGLFEMAAINPPYHPAKTPLSTGFVLPFMSPRTIMQGAMWNVEGYKQPAIVNEYKKWNGKIMFALWSSQIETMSRVPIRKAEDWKGVRIRAYGDTGKVLEQFGAVQNLIPLADTYMALEKGMIDAMSTSWSYAFGSFNAHEVTKYAILMGMSGGGSVVVANQNAWDALPANVKKVHEELMKQYPEVMVKPYADEDAKWIPIFKKAGVEIIEWAPEETAKLANVAKAKIWTDWANGIDKQGLPGTDFLNYLIKSADEAKAKYK